MNTTPEAPSRPRPAARRLRVPEPRRGGQRPAGDSSRRGEFRPGQSRTVQPGMGQSRTVQSAVGKSAAGKSGPGLSGLRQPDMRQSRTVPSALGTSRAGKPGVREPGTGRQRDAAPATGRRRSAQSGTGRQRDAAPATGRPEAAPTGLLSARPQSHRVRPAGPARSAPARSAPAGPSAAGSAAGGPATLRSATGGPATIGSPAGAGADQRVAAPARGPAASMPLPRIPFVLLILGLLGGGLVCLLVVNTTLGATSFRISQLQSANASLARQEQGLLGQVANEQSPAGIEQRAYQLGMRAETGTNILDLRNGRYYQVPDHAGAAALDGVAPPPGSKPAAPGKADTARKSATASKAAARHRSGAQKPAKHRRRVRHSRRARKDRAATGPGTAARAGSSR